MVDDRNLHDIARRARYEMGCSIATGLAFLTIGLVAFICIIGSCSGAP